MTLKKLDLCNHNWNEFRKQLKKDGLYLIRWDWKWKVTKFWHTTARGGGDPDNAFSWDIDMGAFSCQVTHRGDGSKMDPEFQFVYEIDDPDLIAHNAKQLLEESIENDEDDVEW